ncbi:MAG: tetratricopeptide repeat-containing sensor histidine kinase [Bacteroidales bacterium]|nr:tetratricopeptide repeat-containing sensor histidine kinase [Bacteroidales bacterium]
MFKKNIIFLCLFLLSFNALTQNYKSDSLVKEYNTCRTDSCKAQQAINIFWYWFDLNQDSAKIYMQEYLNYFIGEKYDLGIVVTSQALAYIEKKNGNYVQSFNILNSALELVGEDYSKIILLLNLAEDNRSLENFTVSIEQIEDAIKLIKNIQDSILLLRAYNRLAATYFEANELNQTLKYIDSSNYLAEKFNYTLALANNYEIAGAVFHAQKKNKKSIDYYLKALKINKANADTIAMTNNFINIGISYFSINNFEEAVVYLKNGAENCVKFNQKYNLLNSLNFLSRAYKELNNYELAYFYLDSAMSLRVILFDEEKNNKINELNKKYEVDKKEFLITQNEKSLAQKEIIIRQQKRQKFSLFILLILVIIFSFLIFKTRKKLKQSNTILKNQQIEMEKQKQDLLVANEKLVQTAMFKQNMTQMIVHDLKTPLNKMISFTKKHSDIPANVQLHNSSLIMLNLVENILYYAKFEYSEIFVSIKKVNLKHIIGAAYEQTNFLFYQKGIKFQIISPSNFIVFADDELLIRVFVNLFTNALKFTNNGGQILVILEQYDNNLQITVKDTGIGIKPEKIDKIFDIYENEKVKISDNISSTGIGLYFCKKVIEAHNSYINVKSTVGKGSEFIFSLKFAEKNVTDETNFFEDLNINFSLTNAEKQSLKKVVEKLKLIEIYEISSINTVLNQVPDKTENIKKWILKVQNSVNNFNVEIFNKLIKLAEVK